MADLFQDGWGIQAPDFNTEVERPEYSVINGVAVSPGTNDMTIQCTSGTVNYNLGQVSVSSQDNETISTPDPSDPRKDIAYIDSGGNLAVQTGSPEPPKPDDQIRRDTFRPAPPDMVGTSGVVLAEIWVPAGATDITASDISDRRLFANVLRNNLTVVGDITDGSSNIVYDQSNNWVPQARLENDTVTVTAGTDLVNGGTVALGNSITINHADTSTQGNVSAGAGAAITDANIDGRGHVTSLSTTDFDGRFVLEGGDTMNGVLDLDGNNLEDANTVVWDSAGGHIEQTVLENDSVTVAGNNVSLGGSTGIAHGDLDTISSDDHHTKYADSDAISAINNDTDHGSTASHNYFSGSHNDLSDVGSSDHHSKYTDSEAVSAVSGSTLSSLTISGQVTYENSSNDFWRINDASGGSNTSPHTLRFDDRALRAYAGSGIGTVWRLNQDGSVEYPGGPVTINGDTVATRTWATNGNINHSDLGSISSNDHHSRYSDGEARNAVEAGRINEVPFNNIENPGTNRSIGIDDSEGPLFRDTNGNTYPLWNRKRVNAGTDINISGGSGAGSTPVTISHANTSSQGNVSTGGATVIDDIQVDGRGHVTNMNTQNRSINSWNVNNRINFSSADRFAIPQRSSDPSANAGDMWYRADLD